MAPAARMVEVKVAMEMTMEKEGLEKEGLEKKVLQMEMERLQMERLGLVTLARVRATGRSLNILVHRRRRV
jgi:hypothetical protein